jgi:sigma-B regulation protein RsbU (phosphoserine phosphatase)
VINCVLLDLIQPEVNGWRGRMMKVLVADDDVVTRHLLETTLKSWGYEVWSASDGAEALRILEDGPRPDVAFLDWQMPERDGLEVCRIIRARPQTLPVYVIILTALGGRQNIVQGLQAGADDYITKPFDREELRARLEVGRRIVELQHSLTERVRELEDALARVKQLQGLVPICSYCKKIRNDRNYWQQLESYISDHSEAKFSHGICPECYEKVVKSELGTSPSGDQG